MADNLCGTMAELSRNKKLAKKGRDAVLVTVSALAISSFSTDAYAAMQIDCTGNPIRMGQNIPCSASGRYTVRPDGAVITNAGCVVFVVPPQVAQCVVRNIGAPTTRDHLMAFPLHSIPVNDGGNSVVLNNFRMKRTGTGAVNQASLLLTSAEINGTVTLDVGFRVDFTNPGSIGSYVGAVSMTGTPQ